MLVYHNDQLRGEVATRLTYGVSFTHPASKFLFRSFRMGISFVMPSVQTWSQTRNQNEHHTWTALENTKWIPQLVKLLSWQFNHCLFPAVISLGDFIQISTAKGPKWKEATGASPELAAAKPPSIGPSSKWCTSVQKTGSDASSNRRWRDSVVSSLLRLLLHQIAVIVLPRLLQHPLPAASARHFLTFHFQMYLLQERNDVSWTWPNSAFLPPKYHLKDLPHHWFQHCW